MFEARKTRAPAALGIAMALAAGSAIGATALVSPVLPPVLALGGLLVASLLALPLRPIYFLYALIVIVPMSAALSRGELIPFLVPSEAVLVITAAFAVLYAVLARRENRIPAHLLWAAAIFVVGTSLIPIASYLFRGASLGVTDLLSLVAPVQYLILFWICAHVPRSETERRAAVQLMILMGSAVSLIGLLQAAEVGPVVSWLESWYPTPHGEVSSEQGRVTSVFGAWNALGLFLVTTLLLVAGTYPDERRRLYRLNMRVATMLALVCLLATNLWSGMIGVVLGFAFIKWLDPRGLRALIPLTLVGLVGVVLLLPEISQRFAHQASASSWVPETLVFRWGIWQDIFVPRIAESPIWGVRPSFAGLAWPYPESQYIGYLYRSGAVSLLAHVAWLLLTAAWLARTLRRPSSSTLRRGLTLVSSSLVIVLSLIGIINPVFTYAGTMDYFWIVLGLIVNAGTVEAHEPTAT